MAASQPSILFGGTLLAALDGRTRIAPVFLVPGSVGASQPSIVVEGLVLAGRGAALLRM